MSENIDSDLKKLQVLSVENDSNLNSCLVKYKLTG